MRPTCSNSGLHRFRPSQTSCSRSRRCPHRATLPTCSASASPRPTPWACRSPTSRKWRSRLAVTTRQRRHLGEWRVRGPAARGLCGRPGRGDGVADGRLVSRLRQLGGVRHPVLRPVRSHAACVAMRRPMGARQARVRAPRGVRVDGQSRRARQGLGGRAFADRLPLVEGRRRTSAISCARASAGRCARRGAATRPCTARRWR